MIKIGLDLHGVVDTFPEKFAELAVSIVESGGEVHIITGLIRDEKIENQLTEWGVPFTHYFSIVDELIYQGEHIDWVDDLPYADKEKWDAAKSIYCKEKGIDFMIDDSPRYAESFDDIDTTYLQLRNIDRKIYSVRKK